MTLASVVQSSITGSGSQHTPSALGCSGWFTASSRELWVVLVDPPLPRLGDAQGLPTGSEVDRTSRNQCSSLLAP